MSALKSTPHRKDDSLRYVLRDKDDKRQFNRREDYWRTVFLLLLLCGIFFGVGLFYVIF
ncbi:MAG: hypothetical protein RRY34_04220 [Victivallaceae bacterium]